MKLYQHENNKEVKVVLHQEKHIEAFEKQGFKCLGECDKTGKLIKEVVKAKEDK